MRLRLIILAILASAFVLADSFGGGGGSGSGVGPGATAYNSVTQTVNASTTTQLTFDTNLYDTGAIHSTSVNPTRFTAPSTGFYLATCSTKTTAANKDIFMNFLVNGSLPTPSNVTTISAAVAAGVGAAAITGIFKLNATDFVECSVFSGSGFISNAASSTMQLTKLSTTF